MIERTLRLPSPPDEDLSSQERIVMGRLYLSLRGSRAFSSYDGLVIPIPAADLTPV